MLVIKNQKLAESYDYFTKFGKGSFNLQLFAKLLDAKGKNSQNQIEFIKHAKNI